MLIRSSKLCQFLRTQPNTASGSKSAMLSSDSDSDDPIKSAAKGKGSRNKVVYCSKYHHFFLCVVIYMFHLWIYHCLQKVQQRKTADNDNDINSDSDSDDSIIIPIQLAANPAKGKGSRNKVVYCLVCMVIYVLSMDTSLFTERTAKKNSGQ